MEMIEELWAQVQPILASAPVLVVIVVILIAGIVKKLVHLAIIAGVLLLIWIVLQQYGVQLPI